MPTIESLKKNLSLILEVLKNFSTGTMIEIHLKKKQNLESNRVIKLNNSLIIFIALIAGIIVYFKFF